jgi:hypothetical protein
MTENELHVWLNQKLSEVAENIRAIDEQMALQEGSSIPLMASLSRYEGQSDLLKEIIANISKQQEEPKQRILPYSGYKIFIQPDTFAPFGHPQWRADKATPLEWRYRIDMMPGRCGVARGDGFPSGEEAERGAKQWIDSQE